MNETMTLERLRLEARSEHHRAELKRAVRELDVVTRVAPLALNGLRRAAPALPYIVLASVAGVLILRLRARSASRFLLFGGLLFDAMRLMTLARSATAREISPTEPESIPAITDRGSAEATR